VCQCKFFLYGAKTDHVRYDDELQKFLCGALQKLEGDLDSLRYGCRLSRLYIFIRSPREVMQEKMSVNMFKQIANLFEQIINMFEQSNNLFVHIVKKTFFACLLRGSVYSR